MITVDRFYHPIEAEIARAKLESEGLSPFLHSVNHVNVEWWMANALGGIRLQVPRSEYELAKEILSLPDMVYEDDNCPCCHTSETRLLKTSWKIAFASLHFLGLPIPFKLGSRECEKCNYVWKPE